MLRAAVLLAGLLLAGPAFASDGTATFKDCWAACDNVRVCTAYGFPPNEEGGAVLRVRRAAEASAVPELDINLAAETGKGVTGPLSLAVDGKAVARTGAPDGSDDDFRSWTVKPGEVTALLAAIARGEALAVRSGDWTVVTLSLSGGSAALRWIDDRQKRAGGVTALVAKGAAPASAVPAPPPLPVIRAAKPVSQAGLTDTPPKAVLERLKGFECEARTPEAPSSSRLAPGVVLWTIPCWIGAYQTSSVLLLADEKGGNVRLADLGGAGDANGRATATSAEFDTDRQELHTYAKGRGVADCGITTTHAWTGKAFVLTERAELGACQGLSQDFWVTTFRVR
jgi:hypothetical protein